jgi:hypothetical protein
MPSTVIYKSGYPASGLGKPLDATASVSNDGLVVGDIRFLVAAGASEYPLGSTVSQSLFKSLDGTALQGPLFVERRSVEVKNGITQLSLGVIGAVNPPPLVHSKSSSTASYTESREYGDGDVNTWSVSYLAETTSVSYCILANSVFSAVPRNANLIAVYAQSGSGILYGPDRNTLIVTNFPGFIARTLRRINETSIEEKSGIQRVTVTQQLVVT